MIPRRNETLITSSHLLTIRETLCLHRISYFLALKKDTLNLHTLGCQSLLLFQGIDVVKINCVQGIVLVDDDYVILRLPILQMNLIIGCLVLFFYLIISAGCVFSQRGCGRNWVQVLLEGVSILAEESLLSLEHGHASLIHNHALSHRIEIRLNLIVVPLGKILHISRRVGKFLDDGQLIL